MIKLTYWSLFYYYAHCSFQPKKQERTKKRIRMHNFSNYNFGVFHSLPSTYWDSLTLTARILEFDEAITS